MVKPTHHPRAGETVTLRRPPPEKAEAQPEDIPLDILFEDDDLLVVNKPAGLVVHPAPGHPGRTLVNALLHHCAGRLSGIGGVARPGIIHRLDKDTSGCVVAARNDAAHLRLSAQFAGRQVEKIYHAIVCGAPHSGAVGKSTPRLAGIPRCASGWRARKGRGRAARTDYQVLQALAACASLLELHLHTGRTHQIRVHLELLGYPVVGDPVYGRRPNRRLTEVTGYVAPRQLLHAARLSFNHPATGERVTFEAPRPEDFAVAVAANLAL